ncbi:hypothetical protein HPB52_022377 [Rhipicephalus sanguineus]|uniref:Brinker DNA-binding domain-containing protein n=1 Tax=Rhipicephalus sanguineus TaxID=34632 RepID=A0A9D4T2T6_RHISA|nr:hypothetical protein HPB52_022377 [Rhipicephalus sanguineus]
MLTNCTASGILVGFGRYASHAVIQPVGLVAICIRSVAARYSVLEVRAFVIFACSMPAKRKSYTAKFKLTAVKYAEDYGNRAAGCHFDVIEKMVRTWRQPTAKLQAMKSDKKADRGKK